MNYEGFTPEQRMQILIVGAVFAFIFLSASVIFSFILSSKLGLDEEEVKSVSILAGEGNSTLSSRDFAVHVVAQIENITINTSLSYTTAGIAIGLVSIGFALFVIGADGAFKVMGSTPDMKLVISSTAPGILCFVLAFFLVCIVNWKPTGLDLKSSGETRYSVKNFTEDELNELEKYISDLGGDNSLFEQNATMKNRYNELLKKITRLK